MIPAVTGEDPRPDGREREVAHTQATPDEDRQELRLAVVMTGGVSLAVWMGGVAHEINRMLQGSHAAYEGLLDLTLSRARVDIVSGASAGGLNGALLATAIAHDVGLEDLRGVWLDQGDLGRLLRDPLQAKPPSVLLGDDFFLLKVEEALQALGRKGTPTSATERPVEVIATVSLLKGFERGSADDFGSVISDREHRGELAFSRGGRGLRTADRDEVHDDFDSPGKLTRLARAARASASFPVAFEPRFLRIDDKDDRDPDNMHGHASFPDSAWAVDGGVLVNKPLAPALRAILRRSARDQVRRVLLYVVPDAGAVARRQPDDHAKRPPANEVLVNSLTTLPRNESVVDDLSDLAAHNERARRRRRERELLPTLNLAATAQTLADAYARTRSECAADRLLDEVAGALATGAGTGESNLGKRDVLRLALVDALAGPADGQPEAEVSPEDAFAEPAACLRAGGVVLDLLRRGLVLTKPKPSDLDRLAVRRAREELSRDLRALERDADQTLGSEELKGLALGVLSIRDDEEAKRWAVEAARVARPRLVGAGPRARRIAEVLIKTSEPMLALCGRARAGREAEAARTEALLRALLRRPEPEAGGNVEDALGGLLDLDTVQLTLGGCDGESEQEIELMQVSADTPSSFRPTANAASKLAGLQLANFGAFYKRSWRANDWLWGRLDGAQRLAQLLIDPYRLRQRFDASEPAAVEIERLVAGDGEDKEYLERTRPWTVAEARAELAFLDEAPGDLGGDAHDEALPRTLPRCAELVARRLQVDILKAELPTLAHAIAVDRESGAHTSPSAEVLADALPPGAASPTAKQAVEHFTKQSVGEESIAGEVGTDLFTSTVSRTAGASASVLHGAGSRLRVLGFVLRVLRGLTLGLYLLTRQALSPGRTAGAVVATAMAAGGVLVAVGAFATDLSSLLFLLGAGVLLAGAILAALRGATKAIVGPAILAVGIVCVPDLLRVFTDAEPTAWRDVAVTAGLVAGGAWLGFAAVNPRRVDAAPEPPSAGGEGSPAAEESDTAVIDR